MKGVSEVSLLWNRTPKAHLATVWLLGVLWFLSRNFEEGSPSDAPYIRPALVLLGIVAIVAVSRLVWAVLEIRAEESSLVLTVWPGGAAAYIQLSEVSDLYAGVFNPGLDEPGWQNYEELSRIHGFRVGRREGAWLSLASRERVFLPSRQGDALVASLRRLGAGRTTMQ